MMCIIEGIDRVGKTTLSSLISKKYNIPVYKEYPFYSNFNRKIMIEKSYTISNLVKTLNASIILDRFHLSEFVYGYLDRNIPYNLNEIHSLEKVIEEAKPILILVEPTNIERSSLEDGRDLKEHFLLFEELFDNSILKNKIRCNYNTFDEVLKSL